MKIEQLSNSIRQTTKVLATLHKAKGPVLIKEHSKPTAYRIDADQYEKRQEPMSILEGITRGETALQEGRTFAQAQARAKMNKWLK